MTSQHETPFEWERRMMQEDPKKWYEEEKKRSIYSVDVDPRDEDPDEMRFCTPAPEDEFRCKQCKQFSEECGCEEFPAPEEP